MTCALVYVVYMTPFLCTMRKGSSTVCQVCPWLLYAPTISSVPAVSFSFPCPDVLRLYTFPLSLTEKPRLRVEFPFVVADKGSWTTSSSSSSSSSSRQEEEFGSRENIGGSHEKGGAGGLDASQPISISKQYLELLHNWRTTDYGQVFGGEQKHNIRNLRDSIPPRRLRALCYRLDGSTVRRKLSSRSQNQPTGHCTNVQPGSRESGKLGNG